MENDEIRTYMVDRLQDKDCERIKLLISTLTDKPCISPTSLRIMVLKNALFVAEHPTEGWVGCAMLCPFTSPTGRKASIEDVVVLPEFRGRGIGRKLLQEVLRYANTMLSPVTLQLTSRPSRKGANVLYRSLGFRRKETNCYTLYVPGAE